MHEACSHAQIDLIRCLLYPVHMLTALLAAILAATLLSNAASQPMLRPVGCQQADLQPLTLLLNAG